MTRIFSLPLRALLVLTVLTVSLSAFAQIGRSGVTGTAVDEAGKPVAGVEISFAPAGETAGKEQVIKADGKGRFANRFLTSGQYIVDVKDKAAYYAKAAKVEVKDAGGILLKSYDITAHPKKGMNPIPVSGGMVTDIRLVVVPGSERAKLIRAIEGGAVSTEVSEVVRLLNSGEVEKALALGNEAMAKTTTEIPELIHLVGLANARLGKFAEGEKHLRRAAELAPDQVEITASLGTMLLEVARRQVRDQKDATAAFGEAEKVLAKAVAEMNPLPPAVLVNYSIALEGSGQTAKALEIMDRISKEDPKNVAVRLRMAALLRKSGQADKAIQVLNSLPGGGDPRAVDSLYNIALDFYNAEDYESALNALKRAEELKSDHALVQRLLGRVYYIAGDYTSSIKHLKRFIELDPKHPEVNDEREMVKYMEATLKK